MNNIEFQLDEKGEGAFYIADANGRSAEMAFGISGGLLTVYHTEVAEKHKNQGVAGKLLERLVEYARSNSLKVVPRCPYVYAQFQRHPEKFSDIWYRQMRGI